jgi:hypothetical protein
MRRDENGPRDLLYLCSPKYTATTEEKEETEAHLIFANDLATRYIPR